VCVGQTYVPCTCVHTYLYFGKPKQTQNLHIMRQYSGFAGAAGGEGKFSSGH